MNNRYTASSRTPPGLEARYKDDGKKNVLGINGAEPDNGVPCLKLFIPGMKAIIVHYDNTPAVKKLEAVGVTLDGRFFKLDGERVATQFKVDWLIKYNFTPEGLVNIASLEKNPMATKKQNPKPLPPAPSGAFDGSKPTRGELELVERVARHDADVKALETAKMGLELAYNYPADDPDGIWARILKERGAGSIDELVDMKSYDLQRVQTGFESDLEAWKERKTLPAPSPEPTPAAKSELDEYIPRDANNRPLDALEFCPHCQAKDFEHCMDKALCPFRPRDPGTPSPDVELEDVRDFGGFFATVHNLGYTDDEAHAFFGVKSMKEVPGPVNDLTIKFAKAHPLRKTEPKSENVTENAPVSNEKASPIVQNSEQVQTPPQTIPAIEKSPDLVANPNQEKNHMTEAPFSANFKLINPQGIDIQFTVRDETVNDGVKKVNELIKILLAQGYTARGATAPAANGNGNGNGNGQPAQPSATATEDTVKCIAISVGTSYNGGKAQLNFDCVGMEHPLRFTRSVGDMVRLLGKVKQADGKPFAAEDLTVNNKFGGAWRVKWQQEGQYKNVLEVLPA